MPRGPAAGGGPGSLGGGSSHLTGFKRALNPNLDWRAIEDEYLSMETPILWFDGCEAIVCLGVETSGGLGGGGRGAGAICWGESGRR